MRVDIKILTQDSLLPTAVVIHTSLAHAGISSLPGAVPSLTAPVPLPPHCRWSALPPACCLAVLAWELHVVQVWFWLNALM